MNWVCIYVNIFWKKYMYLSWIWSGWNWNLKLEFMYFPNKFWQIKFEWFSLQICFQVKNRGMHPHDRDIIHHDHDRSSTSRALLGLTVLDNLVCSRFHIMTVISYITIVTVLTIDHHDRDSYEAGSGLLTTHPHDRDHTLPARDLQKILGF